MASGLTVEIVHKNSLTQGHSASGCGQRLRPREHAPESDPSVVHKAVYVEFDQKIGIGGCCRVKNMFAHDAVDDRGMQAEHELFFQMG